MKIHAVVADLFRAGTETDTEKEPDEANKLTDVRNFAEALKNVT
jgi:hypothetical protein